MKTLGAILAVFLLVGCAPSAASVGTAIAQTQAAEPTMTSSPSPTLVPLASLNLEPLLIQPGDLPAGYSGGQVSNELPMGLINAGPPLQVIVQRFAYGTENAGGATVLLYESSANAQMAFDLEVTGMGPHANPWTGVGERAQIIAPANSTVVALAFVRCHALGTVTMNYNAYQDMVSNYAKRLDARLRPLVCR